MIQPQTLGPNPSPQRSAKEIPQVLRLDKELENAVRRVPEAPSLFCLSLSKRSVCLQVKTSILWLIKKAEILPTENFCSPIWLSVCQFLGAVTSGVGYGGEAFEVPQVILLEILKGLLSPAKTFPP